MKFYQILEILIQKYFISFFQDFIYIHSTINFLFLNLKMILDFIILISSYYNDI